MARARIPLWPALAAGAVLAVTVGGVLAARGAGARAERARGSDDVRVDVMTLPVAARVRSGGDPLGEAPVSVRAARGDELTLELSAVGYIDQQVAVHVRDADVVVRETLVPETRFEGAWLQPDGARVELRRDGDVLWLGATRAKLLDEGGPGVLAFMTYDVVELGPHCTAGQRVTYHYLAARDALERSIQRPVVDKKCLVVARENGAFEPLARAPM